MAYRYGQIGNKYYTLENGKPKEETTEQDIRGRMGDISGATYDRFGVARGDWRRLLGTDAFSGTQGIQNLDPSQAPSGELPMNQDFAGYLKETGQTYDPTKGFSGSATIPSTQATLQGQQAGTINPFTGQPIASPGANLGQQGAHKDPNASGSVFTPAQSTNANNTVYKDLQGNVFKADGTPIDQATFQKMGLNISHINTKESLASRTPGKVEAEENLDAGIVGTGPNRSEQADFFKTIQDRFAKTDEMVANILTAGERSEEEKKLKETIGGLQSSFEAGITDIETGQQIPMPLILGQSLELEKNATNKIKALTRLLDTYKDDREAKYNALVKAYDLSRNSTNDMISLYKLTAENKLGFNSKTGEIIFENPLTGEVYTRKAVGYTPTEDKTTLQKEYEYLASQGYKGSITDFAALRASQYGTEEPPGENTQVVQLSDGRDVLIDKDTGEVIKEITAPESQDSGQGFIGKTLDFFFD